MTKALYFETSLSISSLELQKPELFCSSSAFESILFKINKKFLNIQWNSVKYKLHWKIEPFTRMKSWSIKKYKKYITNNKNIIEDNGLGSENLKSGSKNDDKCNTQRKSSNFCNVPRNSIEQVPGTLWANFRHWSVRL